MYGWDFTRMGPNGLPYRTDGKSPSDYWAYGEPVLAAADGVVAHVRNDIPDYGVGETPPREVLEKDGDVFSGNLVVLDHGNGEYTLTCHMKAGTVPVAIGDKVTAGQLLGRVGNSGVSMYPHVHFNLMDGPRWLEAKGVPALFSDFEKIRNAGEPQAIPLGNPMSGWLIQPR
jgi:murein DD-endopeptidase MepM/ murein hydrolase activator NlpD